MITENTNKEKALALIKTAKKDLEFTMNLKISENSSNTIIRNIYESFRMLGEAIFMIKGIRAENHLGPLKELTKLKRSFDLENLRKLRHKINHYGYNSNISEAKKSKTFAKENFNTLFKKVEKIIKNEIQTISRTL